MATKKQLIAYAKKMRENPTRGELEARLLMKKTKIPFKEQFPLKYYILDFLILNRLLVVEIDGGYHKTRTEKDIKRDKFCKSLGLKVLRINNENVNTLIRRIKKYSRIKGYKEKINLIMNKLKSL